VDVLAIQDLPAHTYQRRLAQRMLAPKFVKSLEDDVRMLSTQFFDEFMPRGRSDFMQDMAWRLPMTMALRLVGFPVEDFALVKSGCSDAIALLSGVSTPGEFAKHSAGGITFFRWTWQQYLKAKRNPQDNLTGALIQAANDPADPLTDEEAVSMIFQILIAGSDSSASTMGNAVKMLIENPQIEQRLRAEPERINDFVEEVLRLESAFQGHFRITKQDTQLHDIALPKGSRVFLMWASANRDERFWKNPEVIDIDRENLRRHVTFGYGPHACLGRELARMEIRIVITELLRRTKQLAIVGPTPYVASVFARTLVELPIAFELADADPQYDKTTSMSDINRCPFHQNAEAV
jgi:cytochrome P450